MNRSAKVFCTDIASAVNGDPRMTVDARLALDGDHHIVRPDVVTHLVIRLRRIAEHHDESRALQLPHAALVIQVEDAQRLDLVIEQLHAQRFIRLPAEEIQNAATACELPALRHLGQPLIARLAQFLGEGIHVKLLPHRDEALLLLDLAQRRHLLIQTIRAQHDRLLALAQLRQHRDTLRRHLGVG